jgi:hypothetical protein
VASEWIITVITAAKFCERVVLDLQPAARGAVAISIKG